MPSPETRKPTHERYDWIRVGAKLWFNYPDGQEPDQPDFEVVGFVPEGEHRAGQPLLRELKPKRLLGREVAPVGRVVATHEAFLLPMPFTVAHGPSDARQVWWAEHGEAMQGLPAGVAALDEGGEG